MATAQSAVTFAVCILLITELILAKKDYYDILGVPKDATERQIKKAFHKLAMKYHPDKNKRPDAEVRFREIAEGTVDSFFLGFFRRVKKIQIFSHLSWPQDIITILKMLMRHSTKFFPVLTDFCLVFSAYETLADETRRTEYDRFGDTFAYFTGETQDRHRQSGPQPFTFNFDDILKDFDIYSQNRHARHRRHFYEHSRSHKESHNKHKRHFQGGFGGGIFDDMFEDVERMFTFNGHTKQTENRFHGASKQHCRTVTQRRGNMVTTYTDCTAS